MSALEVHACVRRAVASGLAVTPALGDVICRRVHKPSGLLFNLMQMRPTKLYEVLRVRHGAQGDARA